MVTIRKPAGRLRELETERYILSTLPTLWLPLHRLDDSSFISADGSGHLCTVTGATWTPQGRSFDGTDDIITVSPIPSIGTNNFTIVLWFKTGTLTAGMHALKIGTAAVNNAVGLFVDDPDTANFVFGMHAGASITKTGLTDGAWHQVIGTGKDGNKISLFADGQVVAQDTAATYNIGTTFFRIGAHQSGGYWRGLQGEVALYINRAFSSLDAQRNYLATKFRYQ